MEHVDSKQASQDDGHLVQEPQDMDREFSGCHSTESQGGITQKKEIATRLALLRSKGLIPQATSELGFLTQTSEVTSVRIMI